ncbi:MAG: lactoylglutathione lyase [Paracoccaceae bacterium]|jgi:lactoylglutathione lyase
MPASLLGANASVIAAKISGIHIMRQEAPMNSGAFSVSLNVKGLDASKTFYEKIGFHPVAGLEKDGWLVLSNGDCNIGLFQGMFDKNMLTFNPGWDQNGEALENFEDVRDLQKRFKADGIEPVTEADETTTGPASFMLIDPDGNQILFDQHV